MKSEQRREFIINVLYFITIAFVIWIIFNFVIPWSLPFVIGFLIAALMQEIIKRISKYIRINHKVLAILVLTITYAIIGTAIFIVLLNLTTMLVGFFQDFPNIYKNSIEPALQTFIKTLQNTLSTVVPGLRIGMQEVNDMFMQIAKAIAPALPQKSLSLVLVIPSFLISSLLMIISSYFFTIDFNEIRDFILKQTNDRTKEIIFRLKAHSFGTVGKFIKSYGIIMSITFIELSIGLSILRIENAIAIALIIAIFDILPVLGTGGIMIPWIVIAFVNNDLSLAVGLAIIYAIVTVIRNIIEPKIVGNQVGAHPLVMLISMFIGIKLLGPIGIFVLPIAVILIKNLNDEGIIHIYKK